MSKKSTIEADTPALSPLAKALGQALTGETARKPSDVKHASPRFEFADPAGLKKMTPDELKKYDAQVAKSSPLVKSVLDLLNGGAENQSVERLAFETDPGKTNVYHSIYRYKLWLLPNEILKRLSIQDDLVASITTARSTQISSFGRPQPDRFSTGYKIEPAPGEVDKMTKTEKEALQEKIADVERRLLTCGRPTGYDSFDLYKELNFSQCLHILARQAVIFGSIAVELVQDRQGKFHSFRPTDAGTIYRAAPMRAAAEAVRADAMNALTRLRTEGTSTIDPDAFLDDQFTWVQVISGYPRQVFTDKELVVHNFYPTSDVELDGYPLTPLDTVIAAVTMHINITNHNKLYFQNGRAARGMLVIKSDNVDESMVKTIRQQYQASINSVSNSWRTPMFGIGSDDEISWISIDGTGRDMEFQYLSDTNARVILSAFQMSPEELPGYAHLSRGSNTQALSESSNEYKLEAHRDIGIRPLLAQFQNFFNQKILPLMDKDVAEKCSLKFVGLDADTAEKESTRLAQDMGIHMTMNEILEKVQKRPLLPELGGNVPLNPQYHALVLDKFVTVGFIREKLFGIKDASKDPRYDYIRDPFYFQQIQMAQAQQAAAQQAANPQPGQPGEGGAGPGGEPGQPGADQGGQPPPDGGPGTTGGEQNAPGGNPSPDSKQGQPKDGGEDLARSLDQLAGLLSKSEQNMPESRKKLLVQQRVFVRDALKGFIAEAEEGLKDILEVASHHLPKG